MVTEGIHGLVRDLEAAFASGAPGGRIAELLTAYARSGSQDWHDYRFFCESGYTRNLVHRSERFELLVLCWDAGQESPIHNHEGQDCWMGVLDGRIEELRYVTPDQVVPGPLAPTDSKVFEAGQVAFIRDDIGLHVVRGADGRPGVSLHLYASPYDACNVYCPDTGAISRRHFRNHSENGELCAQG